MKSKPHDLAEKGRIQQPPFRTPHGANFGAFVVKAPSGNYLKIIASDGDGSMPWEHVSVSREESCPSWDEMCFVKGLFWRDDECVMQLHPPASEYVNNHPRCLHLWKPHAVEIPTPPAIAVGIKSLGVIA